jgi:hypothetical protein
MFTKTKIVLAVAFVFGSGAAALASDRNDSAGWAPGHATSNVITCPALEGYPGCHPDARPSWNEYPLRSFLNNRSQH